MILYCVCVCVLYLGCLRRAGDVNCAGFHPVCLRSLVKCKTAFTAAPVPVGQRAIVPAHTHTNTRTPMHTSERHTHTHAHKGKTIWH